MSGYDKPELDYKNGVFSYYRGEAMTYYQRKMKECHDAYIAAVEVDDAEAQAYWLKEYENYERMNGYETNT